MAARQPASDLEHRTTPHPRTLSLWHKFCLGFCGGCSPYALGFLLATVVTPVATWPPLSQVLLGSLGIVFLAGLGGGLSMVWNPHDNDRKRLLFVGMAVPGILLSWHALLRTLGVEQYPITTALGALGIAVWLAYKIHQEIRLGTMQQLFQEHLARLPCDSQALHTALHTAGYAAPQARALFEHSSVFRSGLRALEEEQFPDAIGRFTEILRTVADSLLYRGLAYAAHGDLPKALQDLQLLVELHPEQAAAWYNHGFVLYQLERFQEALDSFAQALTHDPTDALAWAYRGAILAWLGDDEPALASHERACQLAPQHVVVWWLRGRTCARQGRHTEALQSYDTALRCAPSHGETWYSRGLLLEQLGRQAEALEHYEHAITYSPAHANAWLQRGELLSQQGRADEALASYDHCLAHAPTRVHAWYNRGIILAQLGRQQEALQSYDQVIEHAPTHAAAWAQRGAVLLQLGRQAEAVQSYEQALALTPTHAATLHSYAWMLIDRGIDVERGVAKAAQALALAPHKAEYVATLGWGLYKQGKLPEALDLFHKAVQLCPDDTALSQQYAEVAAAAAQHS